MADYCCCVVFVVEAFASLLVVLLSWLWLSCGVSAQANVHMSRC
jgi:hypothetical protein